MPSFEYLRLTILSSPHYRKGRERGRVSLTASEVGPVADAQPPTQSSELTLHLYLRLRNVTQHGKIRLRAEVHCMMAM